MQVGGAWSTCVASGGQGAQQMHAHSECMLLLTRACLTCLPAAWLDMVAEARAERDELALAKAAAEQRAAELESALSAALSDLESARAQGTPGGEAAKRVAQLSMQKLRGLQQVSSVWVVGKGRALCCWCRALS